MKKLIGLALVLIISANCFAQIKIHAHNDYAQKNPFYGAYNNKADEIEVDVFLVNDSIMVAHSKKEIKLSNTLYKLYLHPIVEAFKKHKKMVSDDKEYSFSLMIDVKEGWDLVYPSLKKEIEQYGEIFNRDKHKNAVQIVISGSRPENSTFNSYPKWLFFDGSPNTNYAKKDLKRVTMISDNFANYSKWKGVGEIPEEDKDKLRTVILQAHELKKPIRFWGTPDTESSWSQLVALGADIINTDKVTEGKTYFEKNK